MKKILFIASILFFISMNAKAQSNDTLKTSKEKTYSVAEQMPEFPGGEEARQEYLKRTIKYTKEARIKDIEGTVYVQCIVRPDGSIDGVKILRGIGGGLDEVAYNAVKNMPRWKPGIQDGEAVNVQLMIPIAFRLSNN